jgi:uncharacterized protein (DUF1697 family)
MRYAVLLRGINVGGRNKVPMAALKGVLAGSYGDVQTYIQSGNLVLDSDLTALRLAAEIESLLPTAFELDSQLIRVLVLDRDAYREVVEGAPAGFGSDPEKYRYDVGFYMGVTAAEVEPHIPVNPEVDDVLVGERAFYHRRVAALASRSRVNKIIGSPVYPSLTLRNWRTTTTLGEMLAAPPSTDALPS